MPGPGGSDIGGLPGPGGGVLPAGGVSAWSGGFSLAGGGGLPGPGGVVSAWSRGGLHVQGGSPCPGGSPSWGGSPCPETPPVDRITDTCKNITLATISLRPVKMKSHKVIIYEHKFTSNEPASLPRA